MQTVHTRLKDTIYVTGLIAVAVSLAIFSLPLVLNTPLSNFNYFTINFLITAFYCIMLLVTGRLKHGRDGLPPLFLLLILFLISAYSLNREMNVFESSTDWLSATLVLVSINYMAFTFFDTMPRLVQLLMGFVLGTAVCLFAYLSVYLIPLYLLSAAAFFLLGISLHTFVPVLFIMYSIRLFKRAAGLNRNIRFSFYAGIASVAVVLVVYVAVWVNVTGKINNTYRYATATNEDMPAWVSVAQTIPKNSFTEKLFKTVLVYAVPNNAGSFFWRMPSRSFDEQKKHDPLMMIASLLAGNIALEETDKIKVLESQYDSRHQAQERLWSGENLQTAYVNTNVRIWPQFALSYTEKTVTVSNLKNAGSWPLRQEAIYTFHLPEGGVVSALSLWINGREEKGVLTTKEKAATAYKTIVGIEQHDPSVVHWQEGNTVSVRVFPVVAGNSRIFKLGITAPLRRSANRLVYDNIYFDGPPARNAAEDITVSFDHKQKMLALPASLSSMDEQHYHRSGNYAQDWSVDFPFEGLSPQGFSFNGKTYALSPYREERVAAVINTIYLDINSSWTKDEFEKVYDLVKNKHVYVYSNALIRMDAGNKDQLFGQMSSLQFSLFPLYVIKHAETALLISKSTDASPDLAGLSESDFYKNTKKYLTGSPRIKLFNISQSLSPYLKTLVEYRVFDYEQGNPSLLQELLQKSVFPINKEDSNHVVMHNAALMITESEGDVPSQAPDHLMRLFAYNHIMQQAGKKLLDSIPEESELVTEAKTAVIVTPVSSMVVLESQEDYDRFKIDQNDNSLGNASLKSKGSVPEPHEWLLLLLALTVLAYIRFRPVLKTIG